MKMNSICLVFFSTLGINAYGAAIGVNLGTAGAFAILAGSTVTNTGRSVVEGNLGVSPGSSITGFPPGQVIGTIYSAEAVSLQAKNDLTTAYNAAAGQPCGGVLTGQDLGGLTLVSGVYCFATSAQLTGTLTLNAQGNPNAAFIFQIGSTLTTASSSKVVFINGGQGGGVFYQVGSSATLGTDTAFAGNILALQSITLNTRASIDCGRALARNGAVTMDRNFVSIDAPGRCLADNNSGGNEIPEPSTAALTLLIGVPALIWIRKLKSLSQMI